MDFQLTGPGPFKMRQPEPILVFVVRVDSEKDAKFGYHKDRLNEMVHMHDRTFGELTFHAAREFTFIHESETRLAEDEEIIAYFSHLLEEKRDSNRELIVAIDDWDGLTSNKSAFLKIFHYATEHKSGVRLHVLPRDTNLYVAVNVDEVCSILTKKVNPYKDTTENNSVLFFEKFKTAFKLALVRHAPETLKMLRETCPEACPRNCIPMTWHKAAKEKREAFFASIPDDSSGFSGESDSDSDDY